MPRTLAWLFTGVILTLLVGGPLAHVWYRHANLRNLRVVKDGVLYRSGQLSLHSLQNLIRDYDIKAVVSLRDAKDTDKRDTQPPDLEEQRFCESAGITYLRITPQKWGAPDGSVPAAEGVRKFLAVMDDPANYPVLVHCFAGVHRTGAYCAIYRMEYDRWTNAQAIAEMCACGYRDLDDEWDLLGFLEEYQPRWRRAADGQ